MKTLQTSRISQTLNNYDRAQNVRPSAIAQRSSDNNNNNNNNNSL